MLVIVSDKDCVVPSSTLPKLRLAGFDPSVPNAAPVPVTGIVSVGFDAFEVIVTLPLTAPEETGENETLNVALCPAVSVTGAVIPLRLNPVPLALT